MFSVVWKLEVQGQGVAGPVFSASASRVAEGRSQGTRLLIRTLTPLGGPTLLTSPSPSHPQRPASRHLPQGEMLQH